MRHPVTVVALPPRGWLAACVTAETIGMTAAAGAARTAQNTNSAALGLAVVVAGGLVEGTALAPAALSSDSDGGRPPWVLLIPAALVLGAIMGAALGAVQATRLRGLVPHPRRWAAVSAWGWAPAMAVIFIGASAPGSDWPDALVVLLGTDTGVVAGATLGVVTRWLMPALVGTDVRDRFVLVLAATRLLRRTIAVLRIRGVRSGRSFELPVQYAADEHGLVVVPGHPAAKRWWRNLRTPAEVEVRIGHRESTALGMVLMPGDKGYATARATYVRHWSYDLPETQPVVRLLMPSH